MIDSFRPMTRARSVPDSPKALRAATDLLLSQPKSKGLAKASARTADDPREVSFALQYLDAFGYLAKSLPGWEDITLADILKAVKKFQGFFGLPKTGQLTAQTVRAMETPRCGFPDVERKHHVEAERVKAWADSMAAAWTKRALTYAVTAYLPGLATADQDSIFKQAFASWTSLAPIEAAQTADAATADIVIATGQGPRSNFDGPGGVLAWAYLPDGNDQQLQMRFDIDETWIIHPTDRGIILLNVAAHEFGHNFGLNHSQIQSALMAPYYSPLTAAPQTNDDVREFTQRYGWRTQDKPADSATPTRIAIEGDALVWLNSKQIA
jgi:hypothetical protein